MRIPVPQGCARAPSPPSPSAIFLVPSHYCPRSFERTACITGAIARRNIAHGGSVIARRRCLRRQTLPHRCRWLRITADAGCNLCKRSGIPTCWQMHAVVRDNRPAHTRTLPLPRVRALVLCAHLSTDDRIARGSRLPNNTRSGRGFARGGCPECARREQCVDAEYWRAGYGRVRSIGAHRILARAGYWRARGIRARGVLACGELAHAGYSCARRISAGY